MLEDSSPWNNSSSGTQPTSFSNLAASTFISSAVHNRTRPRLSSALTNSCGQILSPIHHTSITAAATAPHLTTSKVSDSLTQYSMTASDLTSNATHKSCNSVPQKCANALQANEKPRLPIFGELLNQNTSKTFKHSGLHSQQKQKDAHSTRQTLEERLCEFKKKASTPGKLVFPFPSDQNLHLESSRQKRTFESASALRRLKNAPELQSGVNVAPALRKSFPDLFNPSLSIRAEPAGRDIPQSLNRPSSAPTSTDNKENKGPVLDEGSENVIVTPSADTMNSVVIESASKEQVRYQKSPARNIQHEELGASSVSSEDEMDIGVSSVATGYVSTLSTLLDYMSVDERVKLLPPSTLKASPAPDAARLSNDREAGGGSCASSDSSAAPMQKGLSYHDRNERLSAEERSNLQALSCPPVNWNVPETEDSMMPPVGNRDNFIPVGSESNIQTMGRNTRLFRGVAVGGGSTSLGKQLDANIHITISKASSTPDVDIDNLLPIEERERFLPTGADSESLEKATSSSGSNASDSEDTAHGCYQGSNENINAPVELISPPPYELREFGLTGLVDTNLEGATASCEKDDISDNTSEEGYMDVVERQKYIKGDYEVDNDLPKIRDSSVGQELRFEGHFNIDQKQDKTNIAKSEPDLLLGHSSNFGTCGPDLHQSIDYGENFHLNGNNGLSSIKPGLDSGMSSEMPPSRTPQNFASHAYPNPLPLPTLSPGSFTCPVEEEEDDTDELIKMVSSVLIEPQIGNSLNKNDQTPTEEPKFRSSPGLGNLSSTPDNPHLSETNLNDNVSLAMSNQLTESGRGTLGSSEVSSSPLNTEDSSKTEEDPNLNNQDTSSKTQHTLNDADAISPETENETENTGEVRALSTIPYHESLQNSEKNSDTHSQVDNSVKSSSSHHPLDSESSSLSNDLYLPLSTTVKSSVDNATASDLSSARSYDNDQSQDSDILGRQVNSLLCRTAYLEYRNQNAHTVVTKNANKEIGFIPGSTTYLMPSIEAYKFGTSPHPAKSNYTEKEGLNYDQLNQDLTDLQNGLAQGMQLKNPILQDDNKEIPTESSTSINETGFSANSPDVLQDSTLPTNLFRRTTQQADLLLGMDRILRKKELAFEADKDYSASRSLPLLAGQQRNESLQMTCHEGGSSHTSVPRYPLLTDFNISMAPNLVKETKPKTHSQKVQEMTFILPNQASVCEGGAVLSSAQTFQHMPEVIDDLAIRVERILSEEPLYEMHKTNFLERIRPKDGFFEKLSFESSNHNSIKTETVSDLTETDSASAELPTSRDSVSKIASNLIKKQEVEEQGPYFENNTKGMCFGESFASKESSDNFQVSTLSESSQSMSSLMKESFPKAPDSSDVQPSKNDLPTDNNAPDLDINTLTIVNSSLAFMSTKTSPDEEENISQHPAGKEYALTEAMHFGHNETFPNPVNESTNSIKFLEEDVRKCLDWSNMSTFSSPPKETAPVTHVDNLQQQQQPEMVEHILSTETDSKPFTIATISDISRKRTSVISDSSITSSYVSSASQSGSLSDKSAISSSRAESDCYSMNTVASVCAVSAERKFYESSNLQGDLQENNSHQTSGAISSSSSSSTSSRNQTRKSSATNVSTQRTDLGLCSEDLRKSGNSLTKTDSQNLDNGVFNSFKTNDGLPKYPYKLSLSESQPDFHPKNKMPKNNANKSCSDISALLHSEELSPFLKPKDFADSESLRRDLDALSNYRQKENNFTTPTTMERAKTNENIDSHPTSKSFPSVSPSIVVSPLETEHNPVGSVFQQGDCGGCKRHIVDSNSVSSQFYESSTSKEFIVGKASSSSTNQSRNNSARISSQDSTLKGKKYNTSGQIQSDHQLATDIKAMHTVNQQAETANHVSKGSSHGIGLNTQSSHIQQNPTPCETRETSSSSSTVTSPFGSNESVASHKTWTLRPYKPPGSVEWYYTDYSECLATGESETTTLESADTGSDDAIGPQIPKEFLGSRVDVPSRPGIYSRVINKKKIPVQEDLFLSTIHEKSFVDDRDRSNQILEKRTSQCLYNTNGYPVKCSTAEQGNQPLSSTKTIFAESKARTKDLSRMFCTPQKLEHLISKENKSNQSFNQRAPSFQPLGVENHETKALYDNCRLEADNVEDCRERENGAEKIAANRSVLDLPTKNHSSFESATTTVDTPSGFTTDPDYLINGLRQFEPSLSSADSGQLQDISGVAGPSHPMVRYAPTSQWNSPRAAKKELPKDQNISKARTVYAGKPDIISERSERVVRSSKELDLLWKKFQQQNHSDHDSSLDSERLGHMQQLLKNPTHALVHHTFEKMESIRLKQAKMAAHTMEEQKRALLCSKIQDESDSLMGSIYSNKNSNGTVRRDERSMSSRPSWSSDTLSSIAQERQVSQNSAVQFQGVPEGSETGILDPIMARLRQKIDKQRKKCERMKLRDKASEQKLRKLTHILVNRQMNDLVLAAEMSSLSTTSTASATTASEKLPKSQQPNSFKSHPDIAHKNANLASRQQADKRLLKDNHPSRLDQNRLIQNATGQGKVRVQGHCSKSKQVIPKGCQHYKHTANSPEIPISINGHSDLQRSRPRKKDATTMIPSPRVVSDVASDSEDIWHAIKTSIGIQTSPLQEVLDNSQPNFLVANHLADRSSKTKAIKNKANKGSEAWFISLSNDLTSSTHIPRQYQHPQLMSSLAGHSKAEGKENRKMDVRKQQGVSKKPAGHSHVPLSHALVPANTVNGFHSLSENSAKTLAITNNDIENKITLQEAFFNHMQGWISRSRERQKRIALASEERRYQQQMELEREQMFLNKKTPANIIPVHPFSDNLHKPKKRVLSKKEIRELNERLYKKLPEVVQQKVILNRASEYRTNRIRSRIFSMHVQKSLLTKATSR